jgi:hypothetical protein
MPPYGDQQVASGSIGGDSQLVNHLMSDGNSQTHDSQQKLAKPSP